jgi:hypothetical protein
LLAAILSISLGLLIHRQPDSVFSYDESLDWYAAFSWPAMLILLGIAAAGLAFDSNRELSIFLRLRFSLLAILRVKVFVYFALGTLLWLTGFLLTFIAGFFLFDSTDPILIQWTLWGLLFVVTNFVFSIAVITFTGAVFKGAVASVLVALAVLLGIPLIAGLLIFLELLIRDLTDLPLVEWEEVSYVARTLLWWPAGTYDGTLFLGVTKAEASAGHVIVLGNYVELDTWYRIKPLITSILSTPALIAYAWHRYSRREI